MFLSRNHSQSRRRARLWWIVCAWACAGSLVSAHGSGPTSAREAWELASQLRVEEAHRWFAAAVETGQESAREVRFGKAATLLTLQPKTEANLREAERLLAEIAAFRPADDLAVEAALLHARIPHYHCLVPDRAEALRRYEAVREQFAGNPLAELAAPRIALLRIFGPGPDEAKRAVLEELEGWAEGLTDPVARREFERVLGEGWLTVFRDDVRALPHFVKMCELGVVRRPARLDLFLRTAEMARASGQQEVARDFYARFLEGSARDNRARLVRDRLAEAGVSVPAAGEGER